MPDQDRIPTLDDILDLAAIERATRTRVVNGLPHAKAGIESDWADAISDRACALERLLAALYQALDARDAGERRRVG